MLDPVRALAFLALTLLGVTLTPGPGARAQVRVGRAAHVTIESESPGLGLALVRGTRETTVVVGRWYGYGVSYDIAPVCIAPCEAELAEGGYHFLVSRGGSRVGAQHSVVVRDGSRLVASWEDRGALRGFGWVLFLSLDLAGGFLLAAPFASIALERGQADFRRVFEGDRLGMFVAGATSIVLGWTLGLFLAGLRDLADVRVIPGGIAF